MHISNISSDFHVAYRPDIDGLRAIAVLLVVFYHANFSAFSGGFIGVDVFFVISGFLITKIIVVDIEKETFSFIGFYERRIRRLLPALIAVYISCTILGYFVLLPHDFNNYGKSLLKSSIFVSNIHFYEVFGYFDSPSHTKPLLHTWSLAVEEQFYFLWPITVFILTLLVSRPGCRTAIFIIALSSLIYSQMQIANGDETAAFYLLQSRSWELLIGALIVFCPALAPRARALREVMAVIGLCCILGASFIVSETYSFPGINATLPCFGAVALIVSGARADTYVFRLLSYRPLVIVGLMSYSIYLWHWPIFSYSRIVLMREPTFFECLVLIIFSILVAFISWRVIERRFRGRSTHLQNSPRASRNVIGVGLAGIALFAATGSVIDSANGFQSRLGDDARKILRSAHNVGKRGDCEHPPSSYPMRDECDLNKRPDKRGYDVFLVGDSHAAHYGEGIQSILHSRGLSGRLIWKSGCFPLNGARLGREQTCWEFGKRTAEFLQTEKHSWLVILAGRWEVFESIDNPANGQDSRSLKVSPDMSANEGGGESGLTFIKAIRRLVEEIVKSGKIVFLMGQVPSHKEELLQCVVEVVEKELEMARCSTSPKRLEAIERSNNNLKKIAQERPEVFYFDPFKSFCDDKKCRFFSGGTFLYRDDDHINAYGSRFLSQFIAKSAAFEVIETSNENHSSSDGVRQDAAGREGVRRP